MIVKWKHNKRYGQEESYILGMNWLATCESVEDWGCALCYAKQYRTTRGYKGIDGTAGKADIVADLSTYRSKTPGLFMRHVLEHNYDWRVILKNALESFTKRMSLILYRPLQPKEKVVIPKSPVELDLPSGELLGMVDDYLIDTEKVKPSAHGYETLLYLEKPVVAPRATHDLHQQLRPAEDASARAGRDQDVRR